MENKNKKLKKSCKRFLKYLKDKKACNESILFIRKNNYGYLDVVKNIKRLQDSKEINLDEWVVWFYETAFGSKNFARILDKKFRSEYKHICTCLVCSFEDKNIKLDKFVKIIGIPSIYSKKKQFIY